MHRQTCSRWLHASCIHIKQRDSVSCMCRTHQQYNEVSHGCCRILSTSAFIAFTFASIAVNCVANCSHNWSLFRILQPGGSCSIVNGDRYFSSEGIRSGIPIKTLPISGPELWKLLGLTSVLSLSLHFVNSSFGQHCINQDSSSRTMTHCMESCCNLSVQCWIPSWGGNATLYSLSAVNLESISCMQLRRFLVKKKGGKVTITEFYIIPSI